MMAMGSVVMLSEVRAVKAWAGARVALHSRLDRVLDGLEETMKDRPPRLEDITREVLGIRDQITGELAKALVERQHTAELAGGRAPCPNCGFLIAARPPVRRTLDTMVGRIEISRPYFYCVPCRLGFSPLDEALGLAPGQKQYDLQRAGARLAAEVPYDIAKDLFQELTGQSLSTDRMHGVVNEMGAGLAVLDVAPSRAEIEARIAWMATDPIRRPILVLGIDGANIPTRPEAARGGRAGGKRIRANRAHWQGEWREVKGFRLYLVNGRRILHLLSWHQVQNNEELFESLAAIKQAGLIPEERVRLCVVADGAHWIWNGVHELFPDAREILDYYHCSEAVHELAGLKFADEGAAREQEWVEATMASLYEGEVDSVVRGLRRMRDLRPAVAERIEDLAGYLDNNKGRIDYGFDRRGGYPLGSGGIESANKFICHTRMKRSGAWWYTSNSNHMLALRCARYNGTFDQVSALHQERTRSKPHVQGDARKPRCRTELRENVVSVPGRPSLRLVIPGDAQIVRIS